MLTSAVPRLIVPILVSSLYYSYASNAVWIFLFLLILLGFAVFLFFRTTLLSPDDDANVLPLADYALLFSSAKDGKLPKSYLSPYLVPPPQ